VTKSSLSKDRTASARSLQITTRFFEKGRRYHDLVFNPGGPRETTNQLNLWRGFGVKAKAGKWPLMRAHMREVMAAGIEEQDSCNFRWMTWAVQNPGQQAEVALVFRGLKGTGKGTLGIALCRIFGPHGLQIANKKHLIGSFNMQMSQCSFLFADEAYWPGDKEGEGALKRLITEPTLTIEPKGLDLFTVPNNLRVMIAGNEEWITPASSDERRFAVNEVTADRKGDLAHFNALYAELSYGGLAAMLHDLLGLHKPPASKSGRRCPAAALIGSSKLSPQMVPCPHEFYSDIAMTSGEGEGKPSTPTPKISSGTSSSQAQSPSPQPLSSNGVAKDGKAALVAEYALTGFGSVCCLSRNTLPSRYPRRQALVLSPSAHRKALPVRAAS
jgi:hypothetical protein